MKPVKLRVEHYVALYKTIIRPVMTHGRVFHHTPFLALAEKTPWCVLEYARIDREASVLAVFRTADSGVPEYLVRPRGLDPAQDYQVTRDNSGLSWTVSGRTLMHEGIPVRLDQPLTSELLLFQKADRSLA